MRLYSALLLLSLLCVSVLASPGPKEIGKSKVFIDQNWTFNFGSSFPPTFSFKTFGFASTPQQTAAMEAGTAYTYTTSTDSFGNTLLSFTFSPTHSTEVVELRSYLTADYSAPLPATDDGSSYMLSSDLVAPSPEITSKAQQIVSGTTDKLARLVLLTGWVHNYMTYQGAGLGSIDNASWVFAHPLGKCNDYSHLLISMLHVIGIPAKFEAGFVCSTNCTESGNWGPHAWVEALVNGEWVSVDPTFNEAILLDATHVKFAEGHDQNDIQEQLSASYGFSLSNVQLSSSSFVSLDDFSGFGNIFSQQFSVPANTIGENSIEEMNLSLKSNFANPIALPVSLSVPSDLSIRGSPESLILLQPSQTQNYSWSVVFPATLNQGYVYNYTVQAQSLGPGITQNIIAKKGGDTRQLESIVLSDLSAQLDGSSLTVNLKVSNTGNEPVSNAQILLSSNAGNASQTVSLDSGQSQVLTFSLTAAPGTERVNGQVQITLAGKQSLEPFNIELQSQVAASAAPAATSASLLSPDQYPLLVGGVAIVLIVAVALFILGKRG